MKHVESINFSESIVKYLPILVLFAIIIRGIVAYFYLPFYNQDELTILYDAKSIIETGMDRWKTPTHLFYRSLGESEYRPPLMIWLQTAAYFLFNIHEFGARLISIFFGLIGIYCSYFISGVIVNKKFAYIFLLIILFAPVHIIMSCMAFESATLSSSILLISLYFFTKYTVTEKLSNILFAGFFISLSVYTYPAMKLVSPLIGFGIVLYLFYNKRYKALIYFSLIALLIISPQIWLFIEYPKQFLARAYANVPLRLKGIDYVFKTIEIPLISLFDVSTWFIRFEKQIHNVNILFLITQLPFYIYGIVVLFYKNAFSHTKILYLFCIVFLISCAPEIATFSSVNLFRNPLLIYFIGFIVSLGVYQCSKNYKTIFIVFFVNFCFSFIYGYFQSSRHPNFQHELIDLYQKISKYEKKEANVMIENHGNQAYIYLLYYGNIRPQYFQTSKVVNNCNSDGFDNISQIGKYYYRDLNFIKDSIFPFKNGLLVTSLDTPLKKIDSSGVFKFYEF